MRNPQAFYNNEDIWELAKYSSGQNAPAQPVSPSYVYATLPGETQPEFLLMTTFTPAPMQVNAHINQDETISKDLTLWNQQGSQVLQGQTLVLPVGDTFLYVSPIYLQATQARMPQLKKVVIAVGNRLIYADTYEQALAQLSAGAVSAPASPPAPQQ